jgi:hypothetical protein
MMFVASQAKRGVMESAMIRDDIVGEGAGEVVADPDLMTEGAGDRRGKGRGHSFLRKTGWDRGEHQPDCVYFLRS